MLTNPSATGYRSAALLAQSEECNTGNSQQHDHGNVRQHGSTGLSSAIGIRIGVHGRRVIICKRGRAPRRTQTSASWRLPRGFLDAESCQIDISHSVDHQRQRIMRQIVQRIHGGMDGGDITTVLRHAAHHVPNRVAGIGIGDADMPIKIPDRTVKIGDRPLKTGFFAWPMPLPCYECRFPSRRTSKTTG